MIFSGVLVNKMKKPGHKRLPLMEGGITEKLFIPISQNIKALVVL